MTAPSEDEKQDALAWLEGAADPAAGAPEAGTLLRLLEQYESRENTVIGMCTAPGMHPHRIRDYLITGELP